tara:strand:- start:528 stop:3011 length:2484 start_codon:yes stop_codon:yes gene_type:complete
VRAISNYIFKRFALPHYCILSFLFLNSGVFGQTTVLSNDSIRIVAQKNDSGLISLDFQIADPKSSWRTVLSNKSTSKRRPWEKNTSTVITNIEGAPNLQNFFLDQEGLNLLLKGKDKNVTIEQKFHLSGTDRITVDVHYRDSGQNININRVMDHYYFVPDDRGMGYALPLDLAWIPGLHGKIEHVAGDWFFRSPVVSLASKGVYATLIPDLGVALSQPNLPLAFDLRSWYHPGSGGTYGVPRISYGFCSWEPDGHVFTKPGKKIALQTKEFRYRFDLFLGQHKKNDEVLRNANSFLWAEYGKKFFEDIRPQVLPFEQYGRQYSYKYELKRWATNVLINNKDCYGINNHFRRGANFHAWENDMHVGYGILYYAQKWNDPDVRKIGEGILNLILNSPNKGGAFPCIYNFTKNQWEGSMYWASWPSEPFSGYDTQSMGVTSWLLLYWLQNFKSMDSRREEIILKLSNFCNFLIRQQLSSGAIPTYYNSELEPAAQLKESATTAIGAAVLAKMALITGDKKFADAAVLAGEFLRREILPKMNFQDFEVFYSCAPKPMHWVDPVNGMLPMNTLAIQWSADCFLALHKLQDKRNWLKDGEYCMDILSLFQQIWAPKRFGNSYLYGGFGVMNCDGEWNDGRQARFVHSYVDYFNATGRLEYLQRGVAACRASFSGMDIIENHENNINEYSINNIDNYIPEDRGKGYSPESLMHGKPTTHKGTGGGWTGFNWGPGGGLAASAYLEQNVGSVFVDCSKGVAVPIDGVYANVQIKGKTITLTLKNALADLKKPYNRKRQIIIKFGNALDKKYRIIINDNFDENLDYIQMNKGVPYTL